MRTTHLVGALVSAALLSALPAAAADEILLFGTPYSARPGDPVVDTYGLNFNTSVIQVSRWQAVQSGNTWQHPIPGYLNMTAVNFTPDLYAPLELDAGVEVSQVCARVYDNSNTLEVGMTVGAFESASATSPPTFVSLEFVSTGAVATPGYTLLCATVDPVLKIRTNADINNDGSTSTVQYWVGITLPVGTTTAVGPAVVTWRRTVSPGPATASFGDVPTTHAFFRFIEALAAAGITGGCGSGNYCPNDPITRGQMAVFVSSALGLYWPN